MEIRARVFSAAGLTRPLEHKHAAALHELRPLALILGMELGRDQKTLLRKSTWPNEGFFLELPHNDMVGA